jgi:glycerate kinase
MSDFDHLLHDADLVITGEGRIDQSTGFGKVPYSIAVRAAKQGVPVIAIGGSVCQLALVEDKPLFLMESALTDFISLDDAMEHSLLLLESATERVMQFISLGMNLQIYK